MESDNTRPIVVAVGNDPVDSALEFAAAEAARIGCGVHLVHAVHVVPTGPEMVLLDFGDIERMGRETLRAAVATAEGMVGDETRLTSEVDDGPPVRTVVDAGRNARMIVVQRTDVNWLMRAVRRSVAHGVARHAQVPVVSVPDGWHERSEPSDGPGRVTLGVDIPDRCRPLLAAALSEARGRGAELEILHTWWFPSLYDDVVTDRIAQDSWTLTTRHEIEDILLEFDKEAAGVDVTVTTRHADPAAALIEASRHSRLVVVGRHDPLIAMGSHLGPVVRAVLRRAECPVLLANPGELRTDDLSA
ncbi:universal stress protein [Nocardioides sp.]|uniref:universal stress protein n=1 Tax=Nocardioides sp. TaxID=35761 RepID=UPI003563D0E9